MLVILLWIDSCGGWVGGGGSTRDLRLEGAVSKLEGECVCTGYASVYVSRLSDGEGNGGFQAGGVCEGRPRGFWRPVRDVRTVSGQQVCRGDRKEAGEC